MAVFSSTAQNALRAAQILGSVSAILCILILIVAFTYRLYQTQQQRLLLQIAVASLAFGISGAATYRAVVVDEQPSAICGVFAAFDSTHIAVVVFEITFTVSLLFSMAKRRMPVAVEVPLVVLGWLAATANAVWFGTRCVHEFGIGLFNGLDWFWDTSRTENFFPIALIAVDILLVLYALFRYLQHRSRFATRRENMDFELQFMPEAYLRQLSLLNLEQRSMRELAAPIFLFPVGFLVFSTVYIVAAVALSHTATSTNWVNTAMFMYMAMSLRGIVFFVVYFWYPSMRELLRPANFCARFRRRRIVRPTASKVRFQQGALEEYLLPEDHQQQTRVMGPRGDGELEEYSSVFSAPSSDESAPKKKKTVLFEPYIEMANLEANLSSAIHVNDSVNDNGGGGGDDAEDDGEEVVFLAPHRNGRGGENKDKDKDSGSGNGNGNHP